MNYYQILGINQNANQDEIKKAYRNEALKWHPDKNPNNKQAEEQFKKITEAYNTLSNNSLRTEYDNKLHNKYNNKYFHNMRFNNMFSNMEHNIFHNFFNMGMDMDDDSNDSFNKFQNEKPIEHDVYCTLEELYFGKKMNISINEKTYGLDIKPGFKSNTKIIYNADNIIFIIKEKQHDIYKRNDNDLILTLKISLHDAQNGFKKNIILLDGSKYMLNINKLKNSKYIHKIKGKGMPISKNAEIIGYGDLLIDFDIIFK